MARIWIDIEDASGNKLGDGPITSATGWQNHRLLDRAGEFSFSMPASDPRAALLAEKRIARCWTESPNGPREVGAGIIDQIEEDTSGDVAMLNVSGPDILHELANTSVRNLAVCELGWYGLDGGRGAVHWIDSAAPAEADLPEAYDGNPGTHTATIVLGFDQWLYIGMDCRFWAINVNIYTPNNQAASCQYQYYNEQAGWLNAPSVVDGTIVAGKPFAQSGVISWGRVADWDRCTPTSAAGSWFWFRIRCYIGGTSGISLSEVTAQAEQPTTNGIAQIMALAPAGWSISGYTTTANGAYLLFTGESVLEALTRLAETTGEHFRLGTGRQLVWLRADAPLAGVRAIRAGDPVAIENNADACLVKNLRRRRDASELMTRIIPYGAGLGGQRTTLALTTRTAPSGYTLNAAENFIRSDAAETAYGRIERVVQLQNILPQQADSVSISPSLAADMLFDAALAYLKEREAPVWYYDLEVVKAAAEIQPGLTMHCVYQEWVDGYQSTNVNTYVTGALYVLGLTESIAEDGVFVVGLELASQRRQPLSDAEAIVGAVQQLRGAVGVGADGGGATYITLGGGSNPNADTVDGYHASAAPTAGALLPLNSSAKFPASALDLSGVVPITRQVLAGAGLTGGGALSADVTLNVGAGAGILVGDDTVAIDTAANLTWTGDHIHQGLLTTRHILPEATDTYDLGSTTKLWRKGYLSELDALVFAEQTISLVGGWLVVPYDQGSLEADVSSGATQVNFGKTMTPGHFVVLRAFGQVEYMQVGSLVSGTTYNVTRNLDGSGANTWPKGSAFLVLGTTGHGRIELNAYDTPRLQMLLQGSTYNAQTEVLRLGDLNGNWGYTSPTYGLAAGEYASGKANLTLDPTNGLRLRSYNTTFIQLDNSGNAYIQNVLKMGASGQINIGSGVVVLDTSGILVGYNASAGLRFAGASGGTYSRIYDSSQVSGSGGLGLFSSTQYWGIHESGGAKLAMDSGFLKLQPREGATNALFAMGDAASNWAMWEANSQYPQTMRLYLDGIAQGEFIRQAESAVLPASFVMVSLDIPAGTGKTIRWGCRYALLALGAYDVTMGTSVSHLFAELHQPPSASVRRDFTASTACYETIGNVAAFLDWQGSLYVWNSSDHTVRVLGWAVYTTA